jgi:hypothetical protein
MSEADEFMSFIARKLRDRAEERRAVGVMSEGQGRAALKQTPEKCGADAASYACRHHQQGILNPLSWSWLRRHFLDLLIKPRQLFL